MTVSVFVEDAAHESFIVGLVDRIAGELGIQVDVEVRNALGGRGSVLTSLRRYVRDVARGRERFADVLVVAIDGNCQRSQVIRREIRRIVERENYAGHLVCAVPNPHIELWYLSDGRAVHSVIGAPGPQAGLPGHKCEKARYKTLLRNAFLDGDIDPPAGGSEYGGEIAHELDLNRARSSDETLDAFAASLTAALRLVEHSADR